MFDIVLDIGLFVVCNEENIMCSFYENDVMFCN